MRENMRLACQCQLCGTETRLGGDDFAYPGRGAPGSLCRVLVGERNKPSNLPLAQPLLVEREPMNTSVQIRLPRTGGGAILTQPATFLPVEPWHSGTAAGHFVSLAPFFGAFLPILSADRKNRTVARTLLEEILR